MPTYRKLERPPHVGAIWKPTVAPAELVGDYEGPEAGDYGDLYVFREPTGRQRKVPDWPSVKDIVDQLKVGHQYRLTFVRMVPLKNGKETREIDVEELVDDETLTTSETAASPDAEVPF